MYYKRNLNKYKAISTMVGDKNFPSRGEAALYQRLFFMEKAKEIEGLKLQPQEYLTAARIGYKPDFRAFDIKLGETIWHEFKGFETTDWRLKRKLWMFYGPGPLWVWKGNPNNISCVEKIEPKNYELVQD